MLQWSFLYSIDNYVVCKDISVAIPIYYSQRSCWLGRILWQGTCVAGYDIESVVIPTRRDFCVDPLSVMYGK
jgi:hypothetical protein